MLNKTRVTLDLGPKLYAMLEESVAAVEAGSKAEVLRRAIREFHRANVVPHEPTQPAIEAAR